MGAFRDEVGGQLMNRSTRMFVDGVALGGAPDRIGEIASAYAMDTALMRERRLVTAAPFAFRHDRANGLRDGDYECVQRTNQRSSSANGKSVGRFGAGHRCHPAGLQGTRLVVAQ